MTAKRRALIVVDVQNEYFDGILQIQYPPREESLANIVRAMDVAIELDMPVVVLQHETPEGSPVFAVNSPSWALRPEIERRMRPEFKLTSKTYASAFTGDGVDGWLAEKQIDAVTIVGYMTNNCDIATAVDAEIRGIDAEILSDASGSIHLSNNVGSVSAEQLHRTLMVLLNSNFAAVTDTRSWVEAVRTGGELPKDNLVTSAAEGRAHFAKLPA